jgi:hypothetical protein
MAARVSTGAETSVKAARLQGRKFTSGAFARKSFPCPRDCILELLVIPSRGCLARFERGAVRDFLDKTEDEVLEDGHIGGSDFGSQAHEIVVEGDVEHPGKAVLDAPARPCGGGERLRGERAAETKSSPFPAFSRSRQRRASSAKVGQLSLRAKR